MSGRRPIGPPPYQRLALEPLAVWEYGSFLAASPFMGFIAQGDGHPVLVLPGFTTSDRSTELLRAVLTRNGHAAHGWKLGRNMGAHPAVLRGMQQRLLDLRRESGRNVSLLGWSLGGIPAEEEREPVPVPTTSIYTRTDGIVRWHTCIDTIGAACENIEVFGTHSGLGYNIPATIAIADRLASPEGKWRPFRPPPGMSFLYPRAVSWTPTAERAVRLAS